jgi:hypothetical protein
MTRQERLARSASPSALPLEGPPLPLHHAVIDPRRLITVPWSMWFRWLTGPGLAHYLQGTHAERIAVDDNGDPLVPASDYRPGTWLWEEDRTVMYQSRIVTEGTPAAAKAVWAYAFGTMRALLADIPADLGAYDTDFLFFGIDYAHTWRWSGTAWEYAPGDRASGEIAWFAADPGAGWALCDGTATTHSTASAGTAAFTTPNLIGRYAKGAGAYTGADVPGSGSVTGATASAGDHAHTIPTFLTDMNAGAATFREGTGALISTAALAHQHYVSTNPPTTTTGAHTHGLGTLAVSGVEPAHVDLIPYFRR